VWFHLSSLNAPLYRDNPFNQPCRNCCHHGQALLFWRGWFRGNMWNRNCRYCGNLYVTGFRSLVFCCDACRFWIKVKRGRENECWPWVAKSVSPYGYGLFHWGRWKLNGAHIFSWELANGPVPKGLCVLHRCDNPPCCNPSHLFIGTRKQNAEDMMKKGRDGHGQMPGELNPNHTLTEQQAIQIIEMKLTNRRDYVRAGETFVVGHLAIWRLSTGRSWRHLHEKL
jgi:hypothetical protein